MISKVKSTLLALSIVLSANLLAEDQKPDMFIISDDNSRIYLFGTMHILPGDLDWLKPSIRDALTESELLLMELDMDDPAIIGQLMSLMTQNLFRMSGEPLSKLINTQDYATLVKALGSLQIPAEMVERIHPGMAILLLQSAIALEAGYAADAGAELQLMQIASSTGKPLVGLETPEQQLSIFLDADEQELLKVLSLTLSEYEQAKTEIGELLTAWLNDDKEALVGSTDEMKEVAPGLVKALMTNRNELWISQIRQYLQDDKEVFIAVGAAHLYGKSGLLELMKEAGKYSIKTQ